MSLPCIQHSDVVDQREESMMEVGFHWAKSFLDVLGSSIRNEADVGRGETLGGKENTENSLT